MTDKMISFLRHINIENIDDFDLDFEMVGYDRFNKSQLNMVIVKDTPWKYSYLSSDVLLSLAFFVHTL